jgi:hypothetical protein
MRNGYKQRTRKLGIPVLGAGDGILADVEMHKWQIVENLLLAATRSVRSAVFSEGSWTCRQIDGEVSAIVSASAASHVPSICGVSQGIYFHGGQNVIWRNLKPGVRNYLYVATERATLLNPLVFRAYSTVGRRDGARDLLVASVDLTGDKPVIDAEPDGKARSDGDVFERRHRSRNEVVEFVSGGPVGTRIEASAKILFANAGGMRTMDSGGYGAGEFTVGYCHRDPAVESVNACMVYNSGAAGVPCRALLVTE